MTRKRPHAFNGSPIMHLYILTSTVNIDVSEITLENGCLPVIHGHQGFEDATKGFNIEPAIWFKVLVIDAISIDCTQRLISWSSVSGVAVDFKGNDSGIEAGTSYCSTDENQPTGDAGRLTRCITDSAFDCGECYSYDRDLDEVFDSVPTLVSEYQENIITREQFHERLMHLLHVSVLPIIKLGCEDITNVSECLKQQDVFLQEVDRKILALTENLEKRRKDKKEQRRKFIDEILRSSPKNPTYPKDLIKVLANDIMADVSEAYDAFDKAQRDVDQSKKLPANACDPNLLQTQRKLRDQFHSNYENMLTVRERLREMKESKASLTKKFTKTFRNVPDDQDNPICAVYRILTKGEEDKVLEIRNLTDKKLLMLSVKEAMRTTLDELLRGEETFGVDADSTGSLKATNVLNSLDASTSWQTLAEQVARVLSNREHLLAKAHVKFCAEVNSRCQRAVEELTIYRRSSSQSTLCIRSSGNSGSSDKSTSDSSLENSISKESCLVTESFGSLGNDWASVDKSMPIMRKSRDSAVSETSCASARTSNASGIRDSRLRNDATGSRKSECSVISEISVVNEHGQKELRKRKDKKDKAKKSSNAPTFHSYLGDEQCINSPVYFEKSSDESVLILKDDRSFLRREIDGLLELIGEHFNDMCQKLQLELKLTRQRYFRKIWLNYESHFYQETMDSLVQLYQLDYTNVTEALCDSLKTLTVSDLSLDDALLSHMLQDVNGTQASPSAEEPGLTASVKSDSTEQMGRTGEGQFLKLLRNKSNSNESCSSKSQLATSPRDPTHRYCSLVSEEIIDHGLLMPEHTPAPSHIDPTSDPSVCALRRHLSELPSRPKTVRLSLNVQYPKSGVIVYERLLCPVRNSMLVEGVATGTVATGTSPGPASPVDSGRSGSSSSDLPEEDQGLCKLKTTTMKPKYRRQFSAALKCIDVVVSTRCPSAKFQHLTRCLREVSHQITNFYQELYGRLVGACSDELMDALVILLCNLDGAVLSQLYCQIMILADIIPPFFNGSPFSFTLVQFVGACQFVQERILLKKNRISS